MATLDVTVYDAAAVMPIMDRSAAKVRYQAMVDFVSDILREGTDYGKVPGTGDKPALLKPGAEKLTTFFGLSKRFVLVEKVEDWTGKDHGGEAFFYYLYRCQLYRGDVLIAECDGSANSWESKYRYRKGERVCPQCGQATIIKGKEEYGGGWLCFAKKGGCGAKFKTGDKAIEDQEVGRIVNPDPADIVNTLQKMSQKRALVGATLLAVNGSDYFTQDVEDYIDGDYSVTAHKTPAPATRITVDPPSPQPKQSAPQPVSGNGTPTNGNDLPFRPTVQGAVNWACETAPQVWPVDSKGLIVKDVVERSFRKLIDQGLTGEALMNAWIAKINDKQATWQRTQSEQPADDDGWQDVDANGVPQETPLFS